MTGLVVRVDVGWVARVVLVPDVEVLVVLGVLGFAYYGGNVGRGAHFVDVVARSGSGVEIPKRRK